MVGSGPLAFRCPGKVLGHGDISESGRHYRGVKRPSKGRCVGDISLRPSILGVGRGLGASSQK